MDWTTKTVWITGASSGIGEALAYELGAKGATLILSSRRKEALETVKSKTKFPEKTFVYPLDLGDSAMIDKVADDVLSKHRVDVLINNGGFSQRSLIEETDMSVYRQIMEVNFFGTIQLSKRVLPHFKAHQAGHFVTVSSLMGKFASQFRSGYAGAKHALHGFFDALRLEHNADHIQVTMICPGFIKTNVSLNALKGDGSSYGIMDNKQESGMTAEECAQKIIRGIVKNKKEVYIGRSEIITIYLKRFFPNLLHRILLNQAVK